MCAVCALSSHLCFSKLSCAVRLKASAATVLSRCGAVRPQVQWEQHQPGRRLLECLTKPQLSTSRMPTTQHRATAKTGQSDEVVWLVRSAEPPAGGGVPEGV